MAAMVLLPIGYWFGPVKLMATLTVVLGLVLAWFGALTSYRTALKFQSRITFASGDTLIYRGPADLFRYKNSISDESYLTSQRLVSKAGGRISSAGRKPSTAPWLPCRIVRPRCYFPRTNVP